MPARRLSQREVQDIYDGLVAKGQGFDLSGRARDRAKQALYNEIIFRKLLEGVSSSRFEAELQCCAWPRFFERCQSDTQRLVLTQ